MKSVREAMLLYAITDRSWLRPGQPLTEPVEQVLSAGATCLQLREKELGDEDFLRLAWELKPLCAKYQVPLIINDNVAVAKAVDADGVHVGQEDMAIRQARAILGPDKWIGTSVHNVAEAKAALAAGCDYFGSGAVFGSHTKPNVTVLTHQGLSDICAATPLPVVAIGGINAENVLALAGTGIDGVAVISALFAQPDPAAATRHMLALAKQTVGEGRTL
ncbi:MAG: thiamine phosphate synthase [Clostridiales bacterium]|nr:thiamine phosphate synthase [Clostridiales bacterium]